MIVIQARMGSSRLPGKVLLRVHGRTLLAILVERMRRVPGIDDIVIATTTAPADAAIAAHADELGVRWVRGSEPDVLQRYVDAAEATGAEIVLRMTADSPLLDPSLVAAGLAEFHARQPPVDYLTTGTDTFPLGMGFEIVTAAALRQACAEARADDDREHVTTYIKGHPELFRLMKLSHPVDLTHHRWAVDTPEDFELVRRMLEALPPAFGLPECLELVQAHPEWQDLNARVPSRHGP